MIENEDGKYTLEETLDRNADLLADLLESLKMNHPLYQRIKSMSSEVMVALEKARILEQKLSEPK